MLNWILAALTFVFWTTAYVWYFWDDIKRWWDARKTRLRARNS